MKATRYNGRAGKHGVYNPKHNDREFDEENSEHIDAERTKQNVYWDCYQGYSLSNAENERARFTFSEVEKASQALLGNIITELNEPKNKIKAKEQIKEQARGSIQEKLKDMQKIIIKTNIFYSELSFSVLTKRFLRVANLWKRIYIEEKKT